MTASRLLIATGAAFLLFAASAQATTSYEQPTWVDNEASALASTCGSERAQIIARMDYALSIHVQYADALSQADPPQWAKTGLGGDPSAASDGYQWHVYWVDTYQHAIELLKEGCPHDN